MLQVVTSFEITQVTPFNGTARSKIINFDFAAEIEVFSSWKNLTDTAVVKFPKNIYVLDKSANKVISLEKQNITQAGTTAPLVLRGDQITITAGYISDSDGIVRTNTIFSGYITEINNRMPIELRCEDNMFALKQLAATPATYQSPDNVRDVLQQQIGSQFTVDDLGQHVDVGTLSVANGSVAQIIDTLRNNYQLECYFKDDTLRVGTVVYYPYNISDAGGAENPWIMDFQYNVISDSLEYKRANTIKLGVDAHSYYTEVVNGKNKNKRICVFVGQKDGEVQNAFYPNTSDVSKLTTLAKGRLNRINVDGWSGKLTTFGLPFIQHGDAVKLVDKVIPERVGTYMVKSVKTTMSISGGLRQEIELDMRVDELNPSDVNNGL